MSVLIGSARIDERGKATGGKAGDQTGSEVSTQSWYLHGKGWLILRPKDVAQAAMIAQAMRAACANNHIGYDQAQRNTLYSAAAKMGFDCAKVATSVETDCSALVRVCCAFAGIMLPDFNTSNLASVLVSSGKFDKITDDKIVKSSVYLRVGDVLVTKTKGHTVVVLTDGPKAHEGEDKPAPVSGKSFRITGNTVNIRSGPGAQYDVVKIAEKGDVYTIPDTTAWTPIVVNGVVRWCADSMGEKV